MRVFALPLVVAYLSIVGWADNGDSDGRRTGGGVSPARWTRSIKRRNLSPMKLKTINETIRRRRAAAENVYLIGHQPVALRGDVAGSDICEKKKSSLLVHVFAFESCHLEAPKMSGPCRMVLNSESEKPDSRQEGFALGRGDLGAGNKLYVRKFGIDSAPVDGERVNSDMDLRLGSSSIDVVLSAIYDCDDPHSFQCQESMCVSQGVICDGVDNCEDGTDEAGWRCGPLGHAKVLTLFAFLILAVVILVPLFLVLRWKRKKTPKTSQHGISTSSSTSSR